MRLVVVVLFVVVVAAGSADAQPSSEPVSERVALGLSLGTTAVGAGFLAASFANPDLIAPGAFFVALGPTTGHIYARDPWNLGLGLRLASGGVFVAGGLMAFSMSLGSSDNDQATTFLKGAAIVSLAGYAGATVYEIATAPCAARRHNQRQALQVSLAPSVGRDVGLVLGGSF